MSLLKGALVVLVVDFGLGAVVQASDSTLHLVALATEHDARLTRLVRREEEKIHLETREMVKVSPPAYDDQDHSFCRWNYRDKGNVDVDACATECFEAGVCLQFSVGNTTGCRIAICGENDENGTHKCASIGFCQAQMDVTDSSTLYTIKEFRKKIPDSKCDANYIVEDTTSLEDCSAACSREQDCKTFSAGLECGCRISKCGENGKHQTCEEWGECNIASMHNCDVYEVRSVDVLPADGTDEEPNMTEQGLR